MERETESDVDDYYVLVRDTAAPAPTDDEYKIRSEQQDLLIADKSSYMWGYVGKLNSKQSRAVQERIDLEIAHKFREEEKKRSGTFFPGHHAFVISYVMIMKTDPLSGEQWVEIGRNQSLGELNFLAKASPELAFLSQVTPACFIHYPEARETWKIHHALESQSMQGRCFADWSIYELSKPMPHESYIVLVSLKTLMETWSQIGAYDQGMDIVRHTAAVWMVATKTTIRKGIRNNSFPLTLGAVKAIFESVVWGGLDYFLKYRSRQFKVILECIDIANGIRNETVVDCKDRNIENKYNIRWTNNGITNINNEILRMQSEPLWVNADTDSATPPQPQTTNDQAVPADTINEDSTASTEDLTELPSAPEPVAEQDEEDIADIVARSEGRWVSQDHFLDPNINSNRTNFTVKTFRTWRETRYIVQSKKNSAIWMDKGGNIFTRKGKDPRNYRYRYFLLKEFDQQPPPDEK